MLDLVKVATLRAVLAHGSFSAAAQELHLTQPAVSRQVASLERSVGSVLVRRTRRGVLPTEAGRVLLAHADLIAAQVARAEADLRELRGLSRGTVRLGSFLSALVHLSAEVGARLDRAHPGIVLVDALVDRAAAVDGLRRGELDVAVVFEHDLEPAPVVPGVEVVPLFRDPLRVLLPAGHRLAGRGSVALGELAAETWVRAHEGSAARRVDAVLARAGLHPPVLLAGRGDEPFEAQALVAAGKGIALTHELTVVVSDHRLVRLPLTDCPGERVVQAAVLPGPRPAAVEAVLRALLEVGAARRATVRTPPP
ncbi:LysR family transcriptional regulator [Geodermatophilus sp. SYSU D00815]